MENVWGKLIRSPLFLQTTFIIFTAILTHSASATCLSALQKIYEKDVKSRYKEIVSASPENRVSLIAELLRDRQFLNSEDHTRLFRRSARSAVTPNYIQNQIEALFYDFLPWLLGDTPQKYTQMLSAQHSTACLGSNRDRPYATKTTGTSYSTSEAMPGFYMKPPSSLIPLSNMMETIRAKYGKKLQNLTSQEKTDLIYELGLYHHAFVRTHPFNRVNNSIVMAQINLIFILAGIEPIWHSGLDFMALGLREPEIYANHFSEYVTTGTNALLIQVIKIAEVRDISF
jgi:hypothetical protein